MLALFLHVTALFMQLPTLFMQAANAIPPEQISTYAQWSIAAGIIGTFVVAVVNRAHWSSDVKFAVFFLWSCVSAAVTAYTQRQLDFDAWFGSLLLVFVAGQATYVAGKGAIKAVEARTG